jgi:hypothetical protein
MMKSISLLKTISLVLQILSFLKREMCKFCQPPQNMATTYKGVLTVVGEIGRKARLQVSQLDDSTGNQWDGFCSSIFNNYSDGENAGSSLIKEKSVDYDFPTNGSNTDRRAVCYFKNLEHNTAVRLTIPAPKASIVEETPEGERIKDASMDALAGELEVLTGMDHAPIQGYIIQKK